MSRLPQSPVAPRWRPHPPRAQLPQGLRPWLVDPASLTSRIRARCQRFSVELLSLRLVRPHRDEAALIGALPGERVWLREVLLHADGRPVVYARSLLARSARHSAWHGFLEIGNRPLGAALFADPQVARGALHSARLDRRDPRYHRALCAAGLAADAAPRALWGRRSCFVRQGQALLVCELFLPAILKLPAAPLPRSSSLPTSCR